MSELEEYTRQTALRARQAARNVAVAGGERKNAWLRRSALLLQEQSEFLIAENRKDLERAPEFGLTDAAIDRLRLSEERIQGIANALEEIILLPDPIGEIFESNIRPNGLLVTKVRVPLGVVFFIYESRPNVTVDAAAICIKSGNAVILRGGKEAFHSNHAFYSILKQALNDVGLPEDAVQVVETTDREAVGHFLQLQEHIDVTIPRGGKGLIERVAAEATMPVIKHFDGICHVYVDQSADLNRAEEIVINSKCQRPGVCNAAETLLVHANVAETFLPRIAEKLHRAGVEVRACERSASWMPHAKSATEEDFRTEYLDLILSVKIVEDLEQAIAHISEYGSHHTDSILTNDLSAAERFTAMVDSAAVMVNASTRFHDGGEFGLGAEIGISTDKFHARGPCGLKELTSYKYVVHGQGQIKS
ncbi:MAG: glutamate-5-semialdehyde dehydrogenase [Planctomycetaceae bacterium]